MSDNQAELQQKYMEYQTLEQQMKQMQKHMQMINDQLVELEYIKRSLADISAVEKGKEILCPLSSGIFVKARIEEPGNFYVNVGNNVVTKKDLDGATKLMESQEEEMAKSRQNASVQLETISKRIREIEKDLMKFMQG